MYLIYDESFSVLSAQWGLTAPEAFFGLLKVHYRLFNNLEQDPVLKGGWGVVGGSGPVKSPVLKEGGSSPSQDQNQVNLMWIFAKSKSAKLVEERLCSLLIA